MRILIIGGTQFIGPHVVRELHQNGHQVIVFNRGKTNYSFPFQINSILGDRADLLSFRDKFSSLNLDVVIDMISNSENDAIQLANTFRGITQRIVIISSCNVYMAYDRLWKVITNPLVAVPLTEESKLREHFYPYRKNLSPIDNDWRYQYDKILVENIIRTDVDINSTILRLPMVYGPGDYTRIHSYLKRMDDNRPILLDEHSASWHVSRGYVEDIAHAITLAALDNRSGNRIYNIGETFDYSESEWIEHIGRIAGWDNEIITLPRDKLPSHLLEPDLAWEQDFTTDTQLIRNELNYKELYSSEQSMQISIEWSRNHESIDNKSFEYDAEDEVIVSKLRI
ncbi:MAG: NAD-dependent epimerase/dehydratase family protein [Tatlockia sp.]|nr:NAD-dependent epimerase/dehydratase family protein [Tatlockia sp.]